MFFTDDEVKTNSVTKGVDIKSLIVKVREGYQIQHYSDQELMQNALSTLGYDVECFENYACITFCNLTCDRICVFEQSPDSQINVEKLRFIMFHYMTVGFNNNGYDIIIVSAILSGITDTRILKAMTADYIENDLRHSDIEKKYKFKILTPAKINTVDIIEVCPLQNSLKGYAARVHAERLQDLPFEPNTLLSREQAAIVLNYNLTDVLNTILLVFELKDQLELRTALSQKYQVDLRSKSDAQIAEAVIASEIFKLTGKYPAKPKLKEGYFCKYTPPEFIKFQTPYLNQLLDTVASLNFFLDKGGSPVMPTFKSGTFLIVDIEEEKGKDKKKNIKLQINKTQYTVGIGGLHSCEKSARHIAGNGYRLYDRDVASYYPRIKLNCRLFPKHIGPSYLNVYNDLVERRLMAKKVKNNVEADSLKITINGAFGKLGSKYSVLYSPDLMLGVTITGQLSLLMLIEALELAGIEVVSANTDGIVINCHDSKRETMLEIFRNWEASTGFETEETEYKMLLSRDVNNYMAVKTDNTVKLKGAYSNPWADKKQAIFRFHKNPMTTICIEAVCKFITDKVPLKETIKQCTDVTKFVCVKKVKGGGYKPITRYVEPHASKLDYITKRGYVETDWGWYRPGFDDINQGGRNCTVDELYDWLIVNAPTDNYEYLGKVVRWYYAKDVKDAIYYIGSGNKVGETDGAKPLMDLPKELPNDIDYDFYIQKAYAILTDIGFYDKQSLF